MGIELELEGFTSSNQISAQEFLGNDWSVTGDGSLRNGGVEFVTNGGKGGADLHACFERMHEMLQRMNYDASFRCSTHMHINMLDFNFNQIARFMLAYTCAEPVLFTFCGNYRRSSNFCVPVCESLPFHKRLIARMYDDAVAARSGQSCNKYTAMNFLPLFSGSHDRPALGTVEFRGGRPLTTLDEFLLQANLLLSLKHYVRQFSGTDDEFLASITTHGIMGSVYSNGVASTIVTPQDQLDEAMVTAWVLLKSYQAGKNSRVRREEPAVEWGPAQPLRTRRFSVDPSAAVPTSDNLEQPAGRWYWSASTKLSNCMFGSTINPGFKFVFREVEEQRGVSFLWNRQNLPWTNEQWPDLHAYFDVLQGPMSWNNLVRYLEPVMLRCPNLRDTPSATKRQQVRMAINMLDFQYEQGHGSFVIDFLLRFSWAVLNRINIDPMPGIRLENPTLGFGSHHEWKSKFNSMNLWERLSRKVPALWAGVEKETFILYLINYVVASTVRAKGRNTLSTGMSALLGQSDGARNLAGVQNVMLCSQMRTVLNILGCSSVNHVHREDLPNYDRYCDVVDFLNANGISFPTLRCFGDTTGIHPTTAVPMGAVMLRNVGDMNRYTMGLGRVHSSETRTARLSATTGQTVY